MASSPRSFPLRPVEIRVLAVRAHLSTPTIERYLAGLPVRPGSRRRITAALRMTGRGDLVPPDESAGRSPIEVRELELRDATRELAAGVDRLARILEVMPTEEPG